MSTTNEDGKQPEKTEPIKQEGAACCGPGCGCGSGRPGVMRYVVGALVLVVAGVLVVRGITKSDKGSKQTGTAGFANPAAAEAVAVADSKSDAAAADETSVGTTIGEFSELNTVAAKTDAVFIFLPGKDGKAVKAPSKMMLAAAQMIETKAGRKCGLFTLRAGTRDYDQVAGQVSVPAVLAMVKGGGMSAVSGEITESKLVQSFVAASQSGGCGPAAGSSCCPAPK